MSIPDKTVKNVRNVRNVSILDISGKLVLVSREIFTAFNASINAERTVIWAC